MSSCEAALDASLAQKPLEAERRISGLRLLVVAQGSGAYLALIGSRGGAMSRRELTKSHARQMVAIREMERAALRQGKPWPPRDAIWCRVT